MKKAAPSRKIVRSEKQKGKTPFFHHVGCEQLPCVVILILFSHLFILWRGYLHYACLSSTTGVPEENKPTRTCIKQFHNLPLPPPSPASLCLPYPTASLPLCPASLPYDPTTDKTRGPAVPSPWCQHFPLIQSQSDLCHRWDR